MRTWISLLGYYLAADGTAVIFLPSECCSTFVQLLYIYVCPKLLPRFKVDKTHGAKQKHGSVILATPHAQEYCKKEAWFNLILF